MTSIPSKILVGVDFSAESEVALRHALAVARLRGAEVVLVHVCSVPELVETPGDGNFPATAHYRELVEAGLREHRGALEGLRARFAGQGVELSHVVADGFPDTVIPQAARELGADLIVLGTHGRTGLRWLLLGSVARRVVRLAESNVLIGRGEPPAGGYGRICVATDFSPSAERALVEAMLMARRGARVDLVHLWHLAPPVGFAGGVPFNLEPAKDEVAAQIRAAGERLVAAHRQDGITLSFEAVFAPPLPGLVDHLERGGHDLVVLGSHGRRGIRRFILGSVAEATVARAPCSALVVHGTAVAAAAPA